jgi:hypothetical protein
MAVWSYGPISAASGNHHPTLKGESHLFISSVSGRLKVGSNTQH